MNMAKILMISLDKNILDVNSRAAERMRRYGRHDEIFIIIPATEKKKLDLSSSVHVFSTGGNKLTQCFKLKFLGGKIIKEQKIDFITTQDPFFTGLVGWWLSRKNGVPWESQVHGDFFGSDHYRRGSFQNRIRYFLGKFLIKHADKIRVVGERVRGSLLKMEVAADKITVRPVFVNVNYIRNYQPRFNLREKYPDYEKIFLVLGRLDSIKNIVWLVNIFSEVVKQKPNYLLLIVGDGVEKNKLIKQMDRLSLEKNIKFEGWTDDPYSYLKTADCLLFPSLSEGYGLVAMEAMAADTPVIMSDVGVANYELKFGPEITIVPVGDKEGFVEAMLKI